MQRLGFAKEPAATYDGLVGLYAAWCAGLPLDNIRSVIARRGNSGAPPPGLSSRDYFEGWLADGAGGTCWPASNALHDLLVSLGFATVRLAGKMRDGAAVNHATVKVTDDRGAWLLDPAMLTSHPLPLDQGAISNRDPVSWAEVEPTRRGHLVWSNFPPTPTLLPCRILPDPLDRGRYVDEYTKSYQRSPFSQRLYVRKRRPDELIVLLERTRYSRSARGLTGQHLSRQDVCEVLRDEVGFSGDIIDHWVKCGGLDACFEAPASDASREWPQKTVACPPDAAVGRP